MDISASLPTGSYRIYAACVGVLTFLVPCIAIIWCGLFVDGFVPFDRLVEWSLLTTPLAAALYLSAFGPFLYRNLASSMRQHKKIVANGLLFVFVPIIVAVMWHLAVVDSLAYVLHLAEGPTAKTLRVRVLYADHGTRRCRNVARLEGSSFLLPRRICGLSTEAVESLRTGGTLEIEADGSSYGFQVHRYRYDVAG